jgi:hypothetical protein
MSATVIDLKPFVKKLTGKRICVFDSETDPFKQGRIPKPFTCGFYDTTTGDYHDFWGPDCIQQFFDFLTLEYTLKGIKCVIYCHNFGGFDCHFMLDHLEPGTRPAIINGRISQCYMEGQEFRDSYRIIPIALREYQKDEFEYEKMEPETREQYKEQILYYQRNDCVYLADLVVGFHNLFGDRPTIGNTSINYLQNFHGFERLKPGQDAALRPFFFGGRNQCFESGLIRGPFKVYDVRSMYPSAMRNMRHPVSNSPVIGRLMSPITAFVVWEGVNRGAVPMRQDDGSLDFTVTRGRFHSTIHEIEAGLETGTIVIHRIIKTIGFHDWTTFQEFIDFCYEQRQKAAADGDLLGVLFWKFVMNSAYGKFAQDPTKYETFSFSFGENGIPDDLYSAENDNGFRPRFTLGGDLVIWAKPSRNRFNGFFNVATGASITGAARSQLLRGLSRATRPIYCDTDSIICKSLGEGKGVKLDPGTKELGTWALEAEGDLFACAGKKLYALFSYTDATDSKGKPREEVTFEGRKMYCVKKASKGAILKASEILDVARGNKVRFVSDRPNFKLDGTVEFIEREISCTA